MVDVLVRENYPWFAVTTASDLRPAATNMNSYDANLVAVPAEPINEVLRSIAAMVWSPRKIGKQLSRRAAAFTRRHFLVSLRHESFGHRQQRADWVRSRGAF